MSNQQTVSQNHAYLPIVVLSLFDGISVAQQSLKELNMPVQKYYASEIDKYVIQLTQKNHPNTIQLGDVKHIRKFCHPPTDGLTGFWNKGIDLLIGGSPCQDLSIAKSNRKGLDGERSGLFWEYVRILKEVKPKYFILENVASMPKKAKDTITKALGVEPIMINAALVSAQSRKRLFWVGSLCDNGTYQQVEIPQPEDRGILLRDILEPKVDESFYVKDKSNTIRTSGRGSGVDDRHNWDTIRIGQFNSGGQADRIYSQDGKSVNLSANGGGRGAKTGLYAVALRNRGEGKKPEIGGDKANAMTTVQTDSMVMEDTIIRKLTPIECERLQSLPEIEQSCIIRVCKDNQKNSVNVEVLNPKSLNVAGSVEKDEPKEVVKSVEKNLNTNFQLKNKPAQVDVSINCSESSIEIYNQDRLLASVSGVELNEAYHPLKHTEDFVRLLVGLNTIVGKTTPFGGAVLPQKSNLLVVKESGNNAVNIYGKGITQLAEDVEKDLTTLNKLLKSTTLDLSIQGNNEQTIQTLFSYVVLAILRYIPEEIQSQNILTFQINTKVGYTYSVSNTQRYKALGNAFNSEVVKHILSFLINAKRVG